MRAKLCGWALAAMTLLSLAPSSGAGGGVAYKPYYVFEFEESVARKGEPAKSRKLTYFTVAELPWTPLKLVPRTEIQGFALTQEPAEFDFQGRKVKGTKLTWKRDPKQGAANLRVAAVHYWVNPELPTPIVPVQLGRSGSSMILVPAGCVRLEVVALEKGADGVSPAEVERSVSASGEYKRATDYKLGGKSLKAHEFAYTVRPATPEGVRTVTVSTEMPGGVCAQRLDGPVSGSFRVVSVTEAPLPKGLETFPTEGFAYAPPAGFSRAAQPERGEVVRYVGPQGAFLSVSLVELDKGGLEALYRRMPSADTPGAEVIGTGFSRFRHLAGHPSFDARVAKGDVRFIFTEHAGRGYKIAVSHLDKLTPEETRTLLSGWRWVDKSQPGK